MDRPNEKPFKVQHDRPGCIACAACSIVAPDYWEMSAEDGKSDLKNSEKTTEGKKIVKEERHIGEAEYEKNKEAADMCPVNVIHLFRKGEKIV